MAATKTKIKDQNKLTTWGRTWRLIASLAISLGVGGLSALISGDAMSTFNNFNQPPLAPPAWLFPVAWTILYILMGIACFLVWIHPASKNIILKEKVIFLPPTAYSSSSISCGQSSFLILVGAFLRLFGS